MSARLFAGIRFFFVKYVRSKLNAFFLDPMYHHHYCCSRFLLFYVPSCSIRFQKLGGEVADHFHQLNDERLSELFTTGAAELQERALVLGNQLAHCMASRDRFKEGDWPYPELRKLTGFG